MKENYNVFESTYYAKKWVIYLSKYFYLRPIISKKVERSVSQSK